MSEPISIHPTELAYALSYVKANTLVGWGKEHFTPPAKTSADAFFSEGMARLKRARRLLPGKQAGLFRFSADFSKLVLTLAESQIVLMTHRKEGKAVRILTHHVAGAHVVELSLGKDGNFAAKEYPTFAGAAGAAAAFVGAAFAPVATRVRIEADPNAFARIKALTRKDPAAAAVGLVKLGAEKEAARSAVAALGKPAASGVISVLYCSCNLVQDTESYAVLTNSVGESWVILQPTSEDGPIAIERTSVSALVARILVGVSARMMLPA